MRPGRPLLPVLLGALLVLGASGCATCPPPGAAHAASASERAAIDAMLDDWHAAAAASDEERYFAHLTADAVFLGTDATERWDPDQLRAYAHRPFSEGRGWRMRSIRRDVIVRGDIAWFDEDLEAVNLGPARGSGVLVRDREGRWRLAHYNLALTIPNERFDEVRAVLASPPPAGAAAEGASSP
jgi:ketosteroid isomerase-like protein